VVSRPAGDDAALLLDSFLHHRHSRHSATRHLCHHAATTGNYSPQTAQATVDRLPYIIHMQQCHIPCPLPPPPTPSTPHPTTNTPTPTTPHPTNNTITHLDVLPALAVLGDVPVASTITHPGSRMASRARDSRLPVSEARFQAWAQLTRAWARSAGCWRALPWGICDTQEVGNDVMGNCCASGGRPRMHAQQRRNSARMCLMPSSALEGLLLMDVAAALYSVYLVFSLPRAHSQLRLIMGRACPVQRALCSGTATQSGG
jgi:hypothetical protein